jgi:hypothetical protein
MKVDRHKCIAAGRDKSLIICPTPSSVVGSLFAVFTRPCLVGSPRLLVVEESNFEVEGRGRDRGVRARGAEFRGGGPDFHLVDVEGSLSQMLPRAGRT